MQAEWEEMARRNWISENQEAPGQVTISTIEKVTTQSCFQTVHPSHDVFRWASAVHGIPRKLFWDMEANFIQKNTSFLNWLWIG